MVSYPSFTLTKNSYKKTQHVDDDTIAQVNFIMHAVKEAPTNIEEVVVAKHYTDQQLPYSPPTNIQRSYYYCF